MGNQSTIASLSPPDNTTIDIDPLDGGPHVLLALTGKGGVVRIRLWEAVGMMRGG